MTVWDFLNVYQKDVESHNEIKSTLTYGSGSSRLVLKFDEILLINGD